MLYKNKFKILITSIVISNLFLIGCTDSKTNEKKVTQDDTSNQISQPKVSFKNTLDLDINNYNRIDIRSADMDNDGQEEDVVLSRLNAKEAYIFICKQETNEVIMCFDAGLLATNLTDIKDVNNDGINDLIILMSSGGTAGSCDVTFVYDSGEYIVQDSSDLDKLGNSIDSKNISIEDITSSLYEKTGASKSDTEYLYSPDDNYVDKNIANKYYIYQVLFNTDDETSTAADYNIIVDKSSKDVYYYYPDGSMTKID